MDQVLTFDKSLQERLRDYLQVLSNYSKHGVSDIRKEWIYHLELTVDPNGWQAVWKVSRNACEELKISFPTVVLVYVMEVNYEEFTALVKVIAVQDDISLPDVHSVRLAHLWPTKEQDKTVALNLEQTAKALDMYRFFYTNVFMPWEHDDDSSDWVTEHLQPRLRLYYGMRTGVIPLPTAEHIRSLIAEGKKLQAEREKIEAELTDRASEDPEDPALQRLLELNVDIVTIKSEFALLEDPLTRSVFVRRQAKRALCDGEAARSWLVCPEGTVDDYVAFLERVRMSFPVERFTFVPVLSEVAQHFGAKDTVVLSKGAHSVGLLSCSRLKGVHDKDDTTLTSTSENIMLDFAADNTVENVTIDASSSRCGVVVRAGLTTLRSCRLVGDGTSSTHQGVIVLAGGELLLDGCEISGFCTAVVGNSGAKIKVANSEIFNVNTGIKIYDGCRLEANNCCLHDCAEFGLCVETDKVALRSGSFELLQIVPDVSIKEMNGKNNGRADVAINSRPKLFPLADLFADPKLDLSTVRRDSATSDDDDMECNECDVTVVERTRQSSGGDA